MKSTQPLILVVEDNQQLHLLLRTTLESLNYRVLSATQGEEALVLARKHQPNVLILDLGLPDIDGQDLIKRLRKYSEIPIIVLSARNQEEDITQALDNGADDYLTKPFSTSVLISHINALLRRIAKLPGGTHDSVKVGDLTIELTKRLVFVGSQEVSLTPTEFNLLSILARHAGLVVTHRYLLEKVWGVSYIEQSHYLRIYMGQLRHKLEADPARPKYLLTEAGVGYRLYGGEF